MFHTKKQSETAVLAAGCSRASLRSSVVSPGCSDWVPSKSVEVNLTHLSRSWGEAPGESGAISWSFWEKGGIHKKMRQKREKMRLLVGGGTLVLWKWTSVVTDRVHWAWVSDLIAYIDFKSSIIDSWQALVVHCWKPFLCVCVCVCAFLCNRGRMILKLNPGFPPKPVARKSRDLTTYSTICKAKIQYSLMGRCMLNCALINCPMQLMRGRPEFISNIQFYGIEYYSVFLSSQFSFVNIFISWCFSYIWSLISSFISSS